jgi:alkylation response protein AidB-like acyl-CoA dehydrogenase
MDFNDSPEEAAFRAEARAWLEKTLGQPGARTGARPDSAEWLQTAKAYQAKKAAAGYVGLTWRKEVGGRELSPIYSVIFGQEEQQFQAPVAPFSIGLGMCIPTVIAFHKPESVKRYVGPALRGEEIWCQLFSEPGAGSDVAASKTKAPCATAMIGSSTARRCGPRARTIPIMASCSCVRTRTWRSTRASPCSSST